MVEEINEKVEENKIHNYFNTEMIGDLLGDQLRQDSNVVPRLEKIENELELKKKEEEKNMSDQNGTNEEETKGDPPANPPFADEEETQRELSNIIWGIFLLTFCTQVLSAFTFLLTNPSATWQAVLVMIIMAAQGTIFGGAIKMLTKKQEYIQNRWDIEKQAVVTTGLEKNNLIDKVKVLEKDNKRVNMDLDNAHAEILGLKKKLYVEETPENIEITRLQKEIADLENKK